MTKEELLIENERFKYIGFKLISLELTDFTFFGTITYNFVDNDDEQDKIYTSVIIGPNGTRKSLLFNLIICIFKNIFDFKERNPIDFGKYRDGDFHLTYALNNEIYEIKRVQNKKDKNQTRFNYIFSRNKKIYDISNFELPITIIGNSITITDKFPFYKKNEFPKFQYLGVKNTPQSSSTKSYIKKTIDFVAKLSNSESFLNGLNLITESFIGEKKNICVSYKTINTTKFFDGDLSLNKVDAFFKNIEKTYKEREKTPPFKLNYYKSIREKNTTELQSAIDYCNNLYYNDDLLKIDNSSAKLIKFNLSEKKDLLKLKKHSSDLNILYSLNIIYDPKIELINTNGEEYSLEESSSGEHNLITSLIGLMATIKTHSLLLIDEPEISLHPNWQMKYVSFLKKLFNSETYKTSHILIASHSHFIVSDLEGSSSKVIGLAKNNGIQIVKMPKQLNTFGWSAEQILLDVFETPTTRNYFVAENVGLMLDYIANPKNSDEQIKLKFKELKINTLKDLSKEDPMKLVVNKMIAKYDI